MRDIRIVDPVTAASTVIGGAPALRAVVGLADGRVLLSTSGAVLAVTDASGRNRHAWTHAGRYTGTVPTTGATYAESTLGSVLGAAAVGDHVLVGSAITVDGKIHGRLIEVSAVDPSPYASTFSASVARPAGSTSATITWDPATVPANTNMRIKHSAGGVPAHDISTGGWSPVNVVPGSFSLSLTENIEHERFFTLFLQDGLSQRYVDLQLDGWSDVPAPVPAVNLVSMTPAVNGWRPSRVTAVFAGTEVGPVECRLDSGGWTRCADGHITTDQITHGDHTLSARLAYSATAAGPERTVSFRVDAHRTDGEAGEGRDVHQVARRRRRSGRARTPAVGSTGTASRSGDSPAAPGRGMDDPGGVERPDEDEHARSA